MPEYRNFWRRKELGVTVHWDDIVAAGRAIIIVNHLPSSEAQTWLCRACSLSGGSRNLPSG